MATLPDNQLLTVEIIAQATVVAGGGDVKSIENVYQFRRQGVVAPTSKSMIEAAFQSNIQSLVNSALSVDYTQTNNLVRFLDDATDPYQAFAESGVGGITGGRGSNLEAVCLRLKTAQRGRSAHGSKHYSPLGESSYAKDVLTSGAVTNFHLVGAAIVAGFTDAAGNLWKACIVSKRPKDPSAGSQLSSNPTTIVYFPVTSYILDSSIGSMRHRKIRTLTA